ncbi:MAG: homocysteine S-methyltransferase family protein [Anaerolineae bacterium]|jgi:5-methyltetrahydrofolate--homocysteine methyltransferase|nr:homocysteine S-methyltransferase family protein [Anaerolineae bacterium]MDX9833087.1 homocysteine S-methyltransferase family protein [Anaerolineae bacterium]
MRTPILEKLASGAVLIADGATGTMLQMAGLPTGRPGEAWVLERPEEILALHQAYLDAGSRLILTATFGGTRVRLQRAGLQARVPEINRRAAELARQAAGDDVYVGGDIGPTGEMMAPLGSLSYEQAVEAFAEQAEALAAGGVDCIYVETMSALDEGRAAVEGARQATDLPIFCTFSFDTRGRTSMGVTPALAAEAVAGLGAAAVGANCGHAPEDVLEILPQIRQAAPGVFLIAKPNAGIPRLVKRQVVYDAGPDRMAELARQYVALGASVVGACCGSSPEHIAAMRQALAAG